MPDHIVPISSIGKEYLYKSRAGKTDENVRKIKAEGGGRREIMENR